MDNPAVLPQLKRLLWVPECSPLGEPEVDVLFSYKVGGKLARGAENFHLLYVAARQLVRTRDPKEVYQALQKQFYVHLGAFVQDPVAIAAGVVAWKGQAVLILGPNSSGRSTLIQALVEEGATYGSDSLALLSADGSTVFPFASPGPSLPVPSQERPLPLGLAAFVSYRPGAGLRLRKLAPGSACLRLFRHTMAAGVRPVESIRMVSQLVAGRPVFSTRRGEARAAARQLLDWLERRSQRR